MHLKVGSTELDVPKLDAVDPELGQKLVRASVFTSSLWSLFDSRPEKRAIVGVVLLLPASTASTVRDCDY